MTESRTRDPSSTASAELRYGATSRAVTTVAVLRCPATERAHRRTDRGSPAVTVVQTPSPSRASRAAASVRVPAAGDGGFSSSRVPV
ncbi:hypothetical protein [Streptomyces sp. 900105755]